MKVTSQFSELNYKTKFKLFWITAALIIFVSYHVAFSKTVELYQDCRKLAGEIAQLEQVRESLPLLKEKGLNLDRQLSFYALDTLDPEKNLLQVASEFCSKRGLRIKQYYLLNLVEQDSIKTLSRLISLEGSFTSNLQLLYNLETKKRTGKIVSAEFQSYVDNLDKNLKLTCTLYIENLISNKHSENK